MGQEGAFRHRTVPHGNAVIEPGFLDGCIHTARRCTMSNAAEIESSSIERQDPAKLPHGIEDPLANGVAFLFREY